MFATDSTAELDSWVDAINAAVKEDSVNDMTSLSSHEFEFDEVQISNYSPV